MKFTKRITAIILAMILIIVPLLSMNVFAVEFERKCPNIEVHGFMASTILSDKNNPESTVVWPPDVNGILSNVKKQLPKIKDLVMNFEWNEFAYLLSDIIVDSIGTAFNNPDGTVIGSTGVDFVYPKPETIKKDSEVKFTYDWRLDPVEIAAKLNDYVNYVLECSGSDKVTIECHSLGGVITLSYLSIYGTDKIKGVCFNSTAVYGETYTGDLMSGNASIDSEGLVDYLKFAFDANTYDMLINGLVNMFSKAGIFDAIAGLGNKIIENTVSIIAKEAVIPMFGGWLTIWAMVPDEYLDDALDYVFNTVYAGEDHTELREKIDNFNNLVRKNKTETLKKIDEDANLYVISRYGYSSLPLTPNYLSLGDGIIDTKFSSFGATTSVYKQKLPAEYINNADPEYISPDKSVDASTCLFPEQTWFVRGMKHFSTPDPLSDFIDFILAQDEQMNVNSFKEYPRFMVYDGKNNTMKKDTGVHNFSFMEKFKEVLNEFKILFHKLFKISK